MSRIGQHPSILTIAESEIEQIQSECTDTRVSNETEP